MRRGAGIAGLNRHTSTTASYASLSTSLTTSQLSSLRTQLEAFRAHLLAFATAHRADIRGDPKLRHEFQKMCAALGIDPLAIGSAPSAVRAAAGWMTAAKGFVGDLLGMSDWQHELAVQIVDVCASTRDLNGGMISMTELITRVRKLRSVNTSSSSEDGSSALDTAGITQEDVIRSVKLLAPLHAGYTLQTIPPSPEPYIRSVPSELETDTITLLSLASSSNGLLREAQVIRETGWAADRTRRALERVVLADGVGWVDEQGIGAGWEVWVPSACKWE